MFIFAVAPYVGAWIEICPRPFLLLLFPVAPYVGAWIEIAAPGRIGPRRRVAPYVGAWIEIAVGFGISTPEQGRSLCGSVD